jgi:hypothetical protein
VHNLAESRSADHFTMMLRGWPSADNEVGVVQMTTLNESKVNHYCITKGICTDPGGLQPLGLRVRIPPGAWKSVSCECCELSGRDLCYRAIKNN